MDFILAQLGGDSWWSWIVWIIFMMVFFMFYPRIMTSQIMWKLEKVAKSLEMMSAKSKKIILHEVSPKSDKILKDSIERFFEFFSIGPVSLDPFGIVKKIEHLVQAQKARFRYFVNQIAPKLDEEKQACIQMGLAGGITLHGLAKIVRHYVELVRKTKSIQIAMILQMQLPLVESLAKAIFKGTQALAKGNPIGDGAAPLVAADLFGTKKTKEIEEGILSVKTGMAGHNVFVIKAKGPGGRIGRPGKAVESLLKRHKINRIITIDAAAKLEGEKTGSVAEGVGVAMGGPGVERSYIENIAVTKRTPLDSIIIKMSQEEAISPMRKAVKDAVPRVKEAIQRSLKRAKPRSNIIIVCVGNTSGIGNCRKDAQKTAKWVDMYERSLKKKD